MLEILAAALINLNLSTFLNPSQQGRKHDPFQAAIKIFDSQGKGVPGARVLFVGKKSPFGFFQDQGRKIEVRSDRRGIARARLTPDRGWVAWACLDRGKERFASEEILIEPGAKTGLRLHPFPVPFIRLKGLKAWREAYGDELRIDWISANHYFAFPFRPIFHSSIPHGAEPVLRLPPLPWNAYLPLLVHKKEGVLSSLLFGPSFTSAAASQPLYERGYPLKHFPLGTPYKVQGKVLDPRGNPVPGARLLFFGERPNPLPIRELRTDSKGMFRFFLAKPEGHVRPSNFMILAPGLKPFLRRSSFFFLKTKRGEPLPPRRIQLEWAPTWKGHLEGAGNGTLYLRVKESAPGGQAYLDDTLPIPLDPKGDFEIPISWKNPRNAFSTHSEPGTMELSQAALTSLFQEKKLDIRNLQRVRILCRREDQGRVNRARIIVLPWKGQPLIFSTPPKGPLEVALLPGKYTFFAHREKHGFAKQAYTLTKKSTPTQILLSLQEGVLIPGVVNTPRGTPIPHATIRAMPSFGRVGSWTEGNVQTLLLSIPETDSQGGFTLEVPKGCPSLSLQAQVLRKGTVYSGASLWIGSNSPSPLRIQITLPD